MGGPCVYSGNVVLTWLKPSADHFQIPGTKAHHHHHHLHLNLSFAQYYFIMSVHTYSPSSYMANTCQNRSLPQIQGQNPRSRFRSSQINNSSPPKAKSGPTTKLSKTHSITSSSSTTNLSVSLLPPLPHLISLPHLSAIGNAYPIN